MVSWRCKKCKRYVACSTKRDDEEAQQFAQKIHAKECDGEVEVATVTFQGDVK